jgi:DNA-binding transcriptional MerR regulator
VSSSARAGARGGAAGDIGEIGDPVTSVIRAAEREGVVSSTGEGPGRATTGSTAHASRSAAARSGARQAAGEQGLLFDEDLPELRPDTGYRGPTACAAAGITYRQLDYWARTGLVEPSVRSASGSGTSRLYSFQDILVLKVVKRLLDTGVSLQQIRSAVAHLRERGIADLAQITLMSDGASVYECTSADEVIDLVQGGQGVFGIAVGRVWREVEGTLAELPGERTDRSGADAAASPGATAGDELSARRSARRIG